MLRNLGLDCDCWLVTARVVILVLSFVVSVGFVFVRCLVFVFWFPWVFVAQVSLFGGFVVWAS